MTTTMTTMLMAGVDDNDDDDDDDDDDATSLLTKFAPTTRRFLEPIDSYNIHTSPWLNKEGCDESWCST